MNLISLDKLKVGGKAVVYRLETKGPLRRRFLDLGLNKNTVVECVGASPLGGIKAIFINGTVIAIREEDLKTIIARADYNGFN